jgi:hypothetical protein
MEYLIPELIEALNSRSLSLFLGADLPQEITGLPPRADLARGLARRKGLDESLSLAEVAQRVSQAGNRWEFTDFIRNALDTASLSPGPFHQRIAMLAEEHSIETIITVAYDNLLEIAFQETGVGFNRVVRGGDVSFIKPDRPTLIKLYGDVQQPDTLVVTDRDHSDLLRDRDKEALVDEVRRAFRRYTLLFLGYNLADPDFRFLFDQIAESRFARTAYAVWPGLPEVDVQMWRDRGIVILDADPFGVLDELSSPPQAPAPPATHPTVSREIDLDRGLEPPSPPPRRERAWVRFTLQITQPANHDLEVRAFETPMGEPHATGQLPYDAAELVPVLKALELGAYQPDQFTSIEVETLKRLGLLRDNRLVPDLLPRTGRELYRALFPEQVGTAFQMAFNEARKQRATVALQLRFDQDAVNLARYPWELLHDGQRHLLSGGAVELTRYIAYPEAITALPASPPWRLLYIAARPQDLVPLPDEAERSAVWNALQSLAKTGILKLDSLKPPTYNALLDQMNLADYHIIHFDGHGVFARCCSECAAMQPPQFTTCRSCTTPLDDVPSQGYLAFEDEFGDVDYVSTEAMENVLLGSEVRLVFLSACQSAVVQGESLFGGLGPGLIRAGVPAVVAMQLSVSVEAAVNVVRDFYTAMDQGETVSRAVAQGRRRLFREGAWFVPTLYLRSADDEGRLFIKQ